MYMCILNKLRASNPQQHSKSSDRDAALFKEAMPASITAWAAATQTCAAWAQ